MSHRFAYSLGVSTGTSLFENAALYSWTSENFGPSYNEITSPSELDDTKKTLSNLKKIDWAFTDDDTSFLTHDLHPYPAKYIPQIPGNLIAQLSFRGDLILDPFGGSGTTALEAIRLGRRAISIDANPVGTLIGTVKTSNIDANSITDLQALRYSLTNRSVNLPQNPELLCKEYENYIPTIPNIDKWFPLTSRGELALIRARMETIVSDIARNIAQLALSRIILKASFQDSETRYSSKPREIFVGNTIKRYLISLDEVISSVIKTQPVLRYGSKEFITADARDVADIVGKGKVDLIVTSPPYGNAMDYHLYHRFRLLWLGHDPVQMAKKEIGSHLRHQKEKTGFDSYLAEITQSLISFYMALKEGRYIALVLGDAVYEDKLYQGAETVEKAAMDVGFERVGIIERKLHSIKRSFIPIGRRATTEKILLLRKPIYTDRFILQPPPYKLWQYESLLSKREIEKLLSARPRKTESGYGVAVRPYATPIAKRLVFTHAIGFNGSAEKTWQAVIENGFDSQTSARKDPKYVTHGLHPYKGKFYPQLAKALINISGIEPGDAILDPFCGSGTTLLEGYLNGYQTYGADFNPLAAKIARAKTGILEINPDVFRETIGALLDKIDSLPSLFPKQRDEFNPTCVAEIERWFPEPVIDKLNWLMKAIRGLSDGVVLDFLEVVLSSIIRQVSQQDTNDLRIRKRKDPINDADVLQLFIDALEVQYKRIEKFWSVRGYAPVKFFPSKAIEGDTRLSQTFDNLGLLKEKTDFVLTSPPYATALPYIDTDRLSLLVLLGLDSSDRRPVEQNLIGSREIINGEKKALESQILESKVDLPQPLIEYLQDIYNRVSLSNAGFRRKNMPALLLRFFQDMSAVIKNCYGSLKPNGQAMIVIGDNRMKFSDDEEFERIPTTDFVEQIALYNNFMTVERLDISVTTENFHHIKNAITENVVLWLKKNG